MPSLQVSLFISYKSFLLFCSSPVQHRHPKPHSQDPPHTSQLSPQLLSDLQQLFTTRLLRAHRSSETHHYTPFLHCSSSSRGCFGIPDSVRNPVSAHSLRCIFQPLLQINLQVPQRHILQQGRAKCACISTAYPERDISKLKHTLDEH